MNTKTRVALFLLILPTRTREKDLIFTAPESRGFRVYPCFAIIHEKTLPAPSSVRIKIYQILYSMIRDQSISSDGWPFYTKASIFIPHSDDTLASLWAFIGISCHVTKPMGSVCNHMKCLKIIKLLREYGPSTRYAVAIYPIPRSPIQNLSYF